MAHYLVLTQQVATSTACPTEAAVTEEATTTTVEATHPEQARVPCDQQLCERPQESTATEPQGAQLANKSMQHSLYAI